MPPVAGLEHALRASLAGEVRFDPVSRALYANDASVYEIQPLGVVVPRSRADIVRVVDLCRAHEVSITMRGGGTSQAGQAIGAGVIVDTSKYVNRILEVNVEERWARVEPGLVLDDLNRALAPHGLRFAPDISTASRATVGGMMANNSSGARSVRYGKTIDHVIEQHVVLSDGSQIHCRPVDGVVLDTMSRSATLEGECYRTVRALAAEHAAEIERRYPKVIRRVGGYNLDAFVDAAAPVDLTRLMVGSEGTLGIVLDATLRLVPLPRAKAVLTVEFDDLLDALAATPAILAHTPAAVEIMDGFILGHTRQSPVLDRLRRTFMPGEAAALLCIELYDEDEPSVLDRLSGLEADLRSRGIGQRFFQARRAAEQKAVWSVREAALGLSMAMKGDAKSLSFVEDAAVRPDQLRDYIADLTALLERHGTTAGLYAHASVGCLHVRPVVNLKTAAGVQQFAAIASDVADLVLHYGGALSGEHGDGLVRSPFMERMFGPTLYEAFRTIKRTFDPHGLFNPGKIVDAPPLTSQLRYGPGYASRPPQTYFTYDGHESFATAVEMCSGLGACRKTGEGTMCPSYMATRDEADVTRGRANVLRLAMAGRLGEAGLGDEGVRRVLDLCLECRACKAECPVGVDVARFKSEFLADHHRRHGTPLRARLLGRVDRLGQWGSRMSGLANAVASSRVGRAVNEQVIGIDRRRSLPRWASSTLAARAADRVRPARVLLFNDTFTNYYHPEIGMAALDVLHAATGDAGLAPQACCGRPMISQGLLGEAQQYARTAVDRLLPATESGAPLVVLEPSCLSSLREDLPDLLQGDARARARRLADRAVSFEEYLAESWAARGARLQLAAGPPRIVLHGHCHQKAMGGLPAAQTLLAHIPGASVTTLDSGCCGMAGSFGYAREHFEVSRAIGERVVLPAARALGPGEVLVASGVSCRHQVADFTGVRALHPAELLRSLMRPSA